MSQHTAATQPTRRRSRRRKQNQLGQLLRALLVSIGVTLIGVLVFALLMQWLRPNDSVIRIVNQLIKLSAIFAGTWVMAAHNHQKGLIHGALVGLIYMVLGVGLYALLSGQQLPFNAYLSDIAMGVAGGGIAGALFQGKK